MRLESTAGRGRPGTVDLVGSFRRDDERSVAAIGTTARPAVRPDTAWLVRSPVGSGPMPDPAGMIVVAPHHHFRVGVDEGVGWVLGLGLTLVIRLALRLPWV